jgi:hypothetical protein
MKLGRSAGLPAPSGDSTTSYDWQPTSVFVEQNEVYAAFEELFMEFYVYSKDSAYRRFRVTFRNEDLSAADSCERLCDLVDEA